jgi:Zn-dependent protease/predicted transcriptional regulator
MRWSWKVAEVSGIGIYVHATFLILVAWVGLGHYFFGGPIAAVAGLVFLTALFVCVVLHELGHALTAKHYGIQTRDITLLPIGGLARLDRMPDDPAQELRIALAGPAVNVVIAAFLALALALWQGVAALLWQNLGVSWYVPLVGSALLTRLMWVNLFLAAFNLLPAFPMDGGRVLRAYLAHRMEYPRATRIAASVGQGMALVFGLAGLFGQPFLLFIALFVYIGAEMEAELVQLRAFFGSRRVRDAMVTEFHTLPANATLGEAADRLLAGTQGDFPIVDGDRLVGLLTRSDLIHGLSERGREAQVTDMMQRDLPLVAPDDSLDDVFQRLQTTGLSALPVVEGSRLAGLITQENIGEFVMVQAASQGKTLEAGALSEDAVGVGGPSRAFLTGRARRT